jgi:Uroporphyrinogen decarboxylase (URO-D)
MNIGFAEMHHDVCFGKANGKIIWQPRIGCWYHDKCFAGEPLPEPYGDMSLPDIYRSLNCSARIYTYNACFKAVEDPAVTVTKRELNATDVETTFETPVGKQVRVDRRTPNSPSPIHVKWEITTEEELRAAIWRTERRTWRWDQKAFEWVTNEWGDLGAPTIFMPRVNIQDLYINTMGTEAAIYALYDWPDLLKAYFDALDTCHERLMGVINESPIDIINFGDNLHAGILPPRLFEEHVLPAYRRRCEVLHRGGKFVHSHWDGDVKGLLPFAKDTGLDGIEAITPQPQGDVTLEEVKDALGDDLYLLDGIPAVYFDTTFPVSVLEECTHKIINLFAPKLVLGISDEISSTGDIERVRIVGNIVDEYNARQIQ